MSSHFEGAAARKIEPDPPSPPVEWDGVEEAFFRRGDAGHVEPPVILPVDSMLLPLVGVAFLAALTLLVLR